VKAVNGYHRGVNSLGKTVVRAKPPILHASPLFVALLLAAGCAVDTSALPGQDGSAGSCLDDPNACDDGVDCTRDSCSAAGVCTNTTDDTLCGGSEVCDELAGCLAETSCVAADCRDAAENPLGCQLGVCQADGTCIGESTCEAGETCCGDGNCMDCDDNNPCTEDSCDSSGCVHLPLDGTDCSDGMFCNGSETCSAGTCMPSTDPCLGDTVCDEGSDRCVGCTGDSDCPGTTTTGWSTCRFEGDATCDETGRQNRTVTTYACMGEECVPTDSNEGRNCNRETTGASCGSDMVTGYTACNYGGNTCANSGSRTRQRTIYRCSGDSCGSSTSTETDTAGCARNTNGTSCGPTTTGTWGECMDFSGTCDESGTRSRTDTEQVCMTGSCQSRGNTVTGACARSTDGTSCGSDTVVMGTCTAATADPCSQAGTMTITTTSYACASGTCTGSDSMETASCTLDPTLGNACGTLPCAGTCNAAGSCDYGSSNGDQCDMDDPCAGVCDEGTCDVEAANGFTCDDGIDCTGDGSCASGVCEMGGEQCSNMAGDCGSPGCNNGSERCDCVTTDVPTGVCGCVPR